MGKFNTFFNRNPTTPTHKLGDCSLANARSGRISENANIPSHSIYHQLQTYGISAFKTKMYIFLLLIFAFYVNGVEDRYFSLDLNYNNGLVGFKDIGVLSGQMGEENPPTENAYTAKLISFKEIILEEIRFDVSENGDFLVKIPYHKDSSEIVIYNDKNEKELTVDVSYFADVCGDGVCQKHESYEDCRQDCKSGGKDDYCDKVGEGKCDPDCKESEDIDCKKFPLDEAGTEEGEAADEVNQEKAIGQNKKEFSSFFYPLITVFIIGIMVALIIWVFKKNRPADNQLSRYIDSCLKMGYSGRQIKEVLVKRGFSEKIVNDTFNKLRMQNASK